MGLDKSDVGAVRKISLLINGLSDPYLNFSNISVSTFNFQVIHYSLPESLEEYVQVENNHCYSY